MSNNNDSIEMGTLEIIFRFFLQGPGLFITIPLVFWILGSGARAKEQYINTCVNTGQSVEQCEFQYLNK